MLTSVYLEEYILHHRRRRLVAEITGRAAVAAAEGEGLLIYFGAFVTRSRFLPSYVVG